MQNTVIIAVVFLFSVLAAIVSVSNKVSSQLKAINCKLDRIARQIGCVEDQDTYIDEIKKLIEQGKKIEAIKFVHAKQGLPLKQAKDYVDNLSMEE